jgi:phage gp16-like protein
MSALDRMMGKAGPAAEPGTRAPSMMESAMLKMLEGVGLDAGALAKVQQDVSAFS